MSPTLTQPPFKAATWIASSIRGGASTAPPAPYFRKPFILSKSIRSARLTVTALGLYEFLINGKVVGDQIFSPGWTDYNKRLQYQVYDVHSHLRQGDNVLATILGEGWYSGRVGWIQRQNYGARPQFIAVLEIVFRDRSTASFVTDTTWKTITGPILENDLLMGESYDARLEIGNWAQPKYDDNAWKAAIAAEAPEIEINLSECPPVRRIEELPSEPSRLLSNGNRVFDLRQNFTGRARIVIRASPGVTVTLRFAEVLNPDGTPYYDNLRSARATDHYTCKSDQEETWEPRFTFHGFRYVEASGLPKEASLKVTGIVLHSEMKRTGTFQCSNSLLNQLQHNILWGQKSNFLEVPTDCPQRDERLGWTGDAQVFIRTAAFNMDVCGFFHKWMRDVRDAQSPAGGIPAVVPKIAVNMEDGGPAWSDAVVICPWTIYLCYGDRRILDDNYEAMVRYLQFLGEKRALNHIRSHPDLESWAGFGDWLAQDGGDVFGLTPKDLIGTAFYAHVTEILSRIAEVLGKKNDAKRFESLHKKIVAAFRRRFVTPDGLLVSGTQTAYILALHFHLLPEALRTRAAKILAKDIERRGFHLATGFVGTPYLLEVLETHGHLDVAYKLLEQETFPSWLFPVKNGATTIWERWDGWTPEKGFQEKGMNSFNHYAYGAVGAWLVQSVAGLEVDPRSPGYQHIIFRPRPGGSLTWAKAELQTAHGFTSIHWQRTSAGLKLDLRVPPGTRASLLPSTEYGRKKKFSPGRYRLTLKKSKARLNSAIPS